MFDRLFYRGPAIDVLHEEYAKAGRLDEQAPLLGSHEVRIEAPVERVWELLSDPRRWNAIDPAVHDVELDGEVAVDTRFTWKKGVGSMKSRFAVVDEGREITWTGLAGGGRAVHRHLLQATPDGATLVRTEESIAGAPLTIVLSSAGMVKVLVTWLGDLKKAAEAAEAAHAA